MAYIFFINNFKIFFGNYNRALMTQNSFRPLVIGRYLKLVGRTVHGQFGMRFEVFGCNYTALFEYLPSRSLGLGSLYILHSQILADKAQTSGVEEIRLGCDPYFHAEAVFLSISGFWQFDLGIKYAIKKVLVQGRCAVNEYIKSFRVLFTDDVKEWFEDKTESGGIREYMVALTNEKTMIDFKKTITARHIRFKTGPLHGHQAKLSMEIYGLTNELPLLNKTSRFPKDMKASSVKTLATTASQAFTDTSSFWCKLDSEVDSWWWADFGVIYYIEKININYKENSNRDNCNDISVQGAQFNRTNMIDQNEVVFNLFSLINLLSYSKFFA